MRYHIPHPHPTPRSKPSFYECSLHFLCRYSHITKSRTLTTIAFVRPISAIVLSVAKKSVVDAVSIVTCELVDRARGFCEKKEDKTRSSVKLATQSNGNRWRVQNGKWIIGKACLVHSWDVLFVCWMLMLKLNCNSVTQYCKFI